MFFRKKPIEVRAVQWRGDNLNEIAAFHHGGRFEVSPEGTCLVIATLEGMMQARPGDWIIEGVKGEIYPCKPDIFEATYEPLPERERDGDSS
jgi:hypothetical protein